MSAERAVGADPSPAGADIADPSSADPSSADRLMVMTHQAYGPLTGVPRILDLLRRRGLRATFFVPGFTAERYPSGASAMTAA